jgi:hypothetical protein
VGARLSPGCGSPRPRLRPGEPSTRILQEAGLASYAVEASSAMVAAFRERFPGVPIVLRDAGLTWVAEAQNEGENHYYFVERRR